MVKFAQLSVNERGQYFVGNAGATSVSLGAADAHLSVRQKYREDEKAFLWQYVFFVSGP